MIFSRHQLERRSPQQYIRTINQQGQHPVNYRLLDRIRLNLRAAKVGQQPGVLACIKRARFSKGQHQHLEQLHYPINGVEHRVFQIVFVLQTCLLAWLHSALCCAP